MKYNISLTEKNKNNKEDIFFEILEKIFFFKKTFFSFKDKEGTLFYRKDNASNKSKSIKWTPTKYDKEKDQLIEGKEVSLSFKEIFEEHNENSLLHKTIPISFSKLKELYKKEFEKIYKKNGMLILKILFMFENSKENKDIEIYKDNLTKEELKIIEELNKIETKKEQMEYLKSFSKDKYEEEYLYKWIEKIYKTDIKAINKINSYFEGRVQLPGKYLVKHNELILKMFIKEKIKKRKKKNETIEVEED